MFDKKEYQEKYQAQYYQDNKDKVNKKTKKWLKNNLEKDKATKRRYYRNHCDYVISAEKKLGRELKDNEVVHHIDMDGTNNDPENLYVYADKGKHSKGHWSLNKLVAELLKDNIIEFKEGIYNLKKELK